MSREAMVQMTAKEYKKAQERVEAMAKNYQETNSRQVAIINRLQAELTGSNFLLGLVSERLLSGMLQAPKIEITLQDLQDHDPSKILVKHIDNPDETTLAFVITKKEN